MKKLCFLLMALCTLLSACTIRVEMPVRSTDSEKPTTVLPEDGKQEPDESQEQNGQGSLAQSDENSLNEDGEDEEEEEEEDPDFYDLADVDETTRYEKAVEIRIYYSKFLDKKISLAGQYYFDGKYHFMRVVDNANCCYADFEIITRDGKYPEEDAWFKLEGVFSVYEENGREYPYIDVYETTPWD